MLQVNASKVTEAEVFRFCIASYPSLPDWTSKRPYLTGSFITTQALTNCNRYTRPLPPFLLSSLSAILSPRFALN